MLNDSIEYLADAGNIDPEQVSEMMIFLKELFSEIIQIFTLLWNQIVKVSEEVISRLDDIDGYPSEPRPPP